jgi:hypothetical protein
MEPVSTSQTISNPKPPDIAVNHNSRDYEIAELIEATAKKRQGHASRVTVERKGKDTPPVGG